MPYPLYFIRGLIIWDNIYIPTPKPYTCIIMSGDIPCEKEAFKNIDRDVPRERAPAPSLAHHLNHWSFFIRELFLIMSFAKIA